MHRWSLVPLLLAACADADGVVADASSGSDSSGTTPATTSPTTTTTATTQSTSASTSATTSADDTTETTAVADTTDGSSSTTDDDPTDGGIFDQCFGDQYVNEPNLGPDYDQFSPVIGSHCLGTNHQDIVDIERVVFLGDSITVGTPPTLSADYYRSQVADALVEPFGLAWGSGGEDQLLWKLVDVFNGVTIARNSGSFASCSKWGARTDDLLDPGTQIADCFPPETRELRTLVVMTAGGNDLSSLTQAAIEGATDEALWAQVMDALALQRAAVEWLKDPVNFPNGSFVVFANMYEFTDGTGDVAACNVSGLAGFDEPIPSPETLADMVIWANEEFMSIAVDTGSDMIFLLEAFCGHGFNADDPAAPCYRGPDTDRWFDLTCIHPNPTGHDQITNMFVSVVDE